MAGGLAEGRRHVPWAPASNNPHTGVGFFLGTPCPASDPTMLWGVWISALPNDHRAAQVLNPPSPLSMR
jgi:hypothetical protein